jgi:hypothetical protein
MERFMMLRRSDGGVDGGTGNVAGSENDEGRAVNVTGADVFVDIVVGVFVDKCRVTNLPPLWRVGLHTREPYACAKHSGDRDNETAIDDDGVIVCAMVEFNRRRATCETGL